MMLIEISIRRKRIIIHKIIFREIIYTPYALFFSVTYHLIAKEKKIELFLRCRLTLSSSQWRLL